MASRRPAEVFPPGDYVREEIEARGWSQADLAEILGRPVAAVYELIAGKRGVSIETAKGLAAAFGTSAEVWIKLDTAYQLYKSESTKDTDIALRARLFEKAPIKEMVKRGWIEPSENPHVLKSRVLKFLEIESLDDEPLLAHAARKATYYFQVPSPGQTAWIFRVKHIAKTIPVPKYSKKQLFEAIQDLRTLIHEPMETRHVSRVLAAAGVRFVVVQPLPGSKLDGACFWMDQTPVVALTLRFDRIDNFWFVLMHELSHVAEGETALDEDMLNQSEGEDDERPEAEVVADQTALELLVSQQKLDSFIMRTRPLYSARKIAAFAQVNSVHPGIVVGQLQHRKELAYSNFRKDLVPVRDIVVASSLTDGWGSVLPSSL